MNNLELWNRVCKTDPSWVKYVDQRGGYSAINAQKQRKQATEIFGPYGVGWGLRNMCVTEMSNGDIIIEADFYYRCADGKDGFGAFPIASNQKWFANGDTVKKIMTDITTKGLSFLGFGSDVFEGEGPHGAKGSNPNPPREAKESVTQSNLPNNREKPLTSAEKHSSLEDRALLRFAERIRGCSGMESISILGAEFFKYSEERGFGVLVTDAAKKILMDYSEEFFSSFRRDLVSAVAIDPDGGAPVLNSYRKECSRCQFLVLELEKLNKEFSR